MPDRQPGDGPPTTPEPGSGSARGTLRTRLTAWWSVRTYRFALLFGGFLLAIALSQTALSLLHRPVEDLAQLYGSGFRLEPVGWSRSALIVVKDMDEAALLCDFIERGGDGEALARTFQDASSAGFSPGQHLGRIGVANQTTMLASESLAIAARLGEAIRVPLRGHLGRLAPGRYRFGVRANHLFVARGNPDQLEISAKVELAEISGSETFIHAAHSGTSWVVQEEGVHSLGLGEEIRVFVEPRHLFVFDQDGGLVAAPGDATPSLAAQ